MKEEAGKGKEKRGVGEKGGRKGKEEKPNPRYEVVMVNVVNMTGRRTA